jgi:RHS repeat-associated protein
MLRGGTTSYYEQDALSSVTSLSNTAGALAQTYTFDSFGNQTASSGSLTNWFRFTGREFDTETNLYYMRARYFDPATGRFISEDPSGFNDGANFFRYVRNNPINYTDPLGLTTYKGFPADKEADLRNAVNEALKKLRDTCSTGHSCAGADGPKIANAIQNATFVWKPKQSDCGFTGPASVAGIRHQVGLGPNSFKPICCSLASTVAHEAVHLGKGGDDQAYGVEKSCFGCPDTRKKP